MTVNHQTLRVMRALSVLFCVLFAKSEEAKMQAHGWRLQQNLRSRQQPRLESLRLHAQSQAKRQLMHKITKFCAKVLQFQEIFSFKVAIL
jgi:hypothetical protein